MNWFKNMSLGTKFSIMVLAIMSVTLTSATYIYINAQHQLFLDNLKAKGSALGDFASLISPESILSYNFENMNNFMREISKEQDVIYGVLVAKNGINLSNYLDSTNEFVSSAIAALDSFKTLPVIDYIDARDDIISMNFPVYFDEQIIGYLRIGLSRKRIDESMENTLIHMMLANVFIILFLSISIYVAFRLMAMKPIYHLRDGLRRVGEGDLQALIKAESGDELGKLSDSFNNMVIRLSETITQKDEFARQLKNQADELRRLRDEALIANQHKSEFLANMSHELRTPLNAVIGFSQMLKREVFGNLNEKQMEYVDDISTSGNHLLSLINEILDLSKVEAGRMELHLGAFQLADSLESAVALFKEKAATHGIELMLDVDDQIQEVTADEQKLKQVLLNLVSNAMKFTPDGGKVHVNAVRRDDDGIEVSVSDTGIGISEEDQQLIFEEFHQGSSEHARVKEGTGLGLTLSQKFVEMHGGKIWVASQPGQGATFTFTIPNPV
ncbi:MAG: HAMP domain-containing protein [Gammaproteobacteria bacterium]|nr:MAG: HAMP domain-containing protein [Gammaproteobacteria bacterium]